MRLHVAWAIAGAIAGVGAILPGRAAAGCTLPNQLTNGQTADASQVMVNFNALAACANTGPASPANSIQYNAGSAFGGLGPLTNGQLVIGSTGNAPVASKLTAGTGIAINNAAGKITISATGAPGVATIYSAGTNTSLTYDPGTTPVALDSCTINTPASTASHTYMVTGQFVFASDPNFASHGQWAAIALDGAPQGTHATWTPAVGQNNVSASVGPILVTVPGDSLTHTLVIQVSDANTVANLTFFQRWVFAQLVQ